jgi:peroxiredoxin Q/BCP
MAKLRQGRRAPAFELPDKDGTLHTLSSFKEKYLIVYFYPRDSTPGCTLEAKEFTAATPKFERLKARVIGISGGDEKTKTAFCKKFGLKVLLLSDHDYSVAKAYGSFGPKVFMGRKFKGIFRNTFILDQQRKICASLEKVTPAGHAEEVLDLIRSISR